MRIPSILWALLCTCCFIDFVHPGAAQGQPLGYVAPNSPVTLQHDGLTALIAAPTEVSLHTSHSFSVMIKVISLNGRQLPKSVTLRSFGKIESGGETGDNKLNIRIQNGSGLAVISFPNLADPGREPLAIEVTTVDEPFGFIGRAEVLLRSVSSIDIIEAPRVLPADDDSFVKLRAVIKDQLGQPLKGVPCIVRYNVPTINRQFSLVWTDEKGIATFTTPPVSVAGEALFQFETERISSDQIHIRYEDVPLKDTKNGAVTPQKIR